MTWNAQEWDGCCTRCHEALNWTGDPPESEEDAICHDCALAELQKLRKAARAVLEQMQGTCDYNECTLPSFAGFMHGLCEPHADECDAPISALKDQWLLRDLKEALRVP